MKKHILITIIISLSLLNGFGKRSDIFPPGNPYVAAYDTLHMASFRIIGIAVKTTNKNDQASKDIDALWKRFFNEESIRKIPGKASGNVFCLYTDYKKDSTGEYTTILGCEVISLKNIPAGFTGRIIPACNYRHYKSTGKLPDCIVATWNEIWKSDAKRKYSADFDVYGGKSQNPANAEVDTYLSVE